MTEEQAAKKVADNIINSKEHQELVRIVKEHTNK
jgi:hypothetical protein